MGNRLGTASDLSTPDEWMVRPLLVLGLATTANAIEKPRVRVTRESVDGCHEINTLNVQARLWLHHLNVSPSPVLQRRRPFSRRPRQHRRGKA